MSVRGKAEGKGSYTRISGTTRVAYALLDLADAVREHTRASRSSLPRPLGCICGPITGDNPHCRFHYMHKDEGA